ncbi:MAG: hypothetical protein WCK31_00300 [bacterium]
MEKSSNTKQNSTEYSSILLEVQEILGSNTADNYSINKQGLFEHEVSKTIRRYTIEASKAIDVVVKTTAKPFEKLTFRNQGLFELSCTNQLIEFDRESLIKTLGVWENVEKYSTSIYVVKIFVGRRIENLCNKIDILGGALKYQGNLIKDTVTNNPFLNPFMETNEGLYSENPQSEILEETKNIRSGVIMLGVKLAYIIRSKNSSAKGKPEMIEISAREFHDQLLFGKVE